MAGWAGVHAGMKTHQTRGGKKCREALFLLIRDLIHNLLLSHTYLCQGVSLTLKFGDEHSCTQGSGSSLGALSVCTNSSSNPSQESPPP